MFVDNEDVTYESGGSRLVGSIVAAVCLAPLLIIGMCFMLGWNERRAVCSSKAIAAGEGEVQLMGCTNPNEWNGALVMMNCDVKTDGLPTFTGEGDFSSLNFKGTGLKVKAEMYQCVEHKHTETNKDRIGGGGVTTLTRYSYRLEWKERFIDSKAFEKRWSPNFLQDCEKDNPLWPSGVPQSATKYAEIVKIGAVKTRLASSIPVDTPISNVSAPSGWVGGISQYRSSKWRVSKNGIGDVRVIFYGNDWGHPAATLLGKNVNGEIKAWTAQDSWLCSGSTLYDLRMGSLSTDELFKALHDESTMLTWLLRFVGFGILWFAFSLFFAPLEVLADCIPCVGPFLGDSIEAVACGVSCLPASACCSLVIGIVWVAMRPVVGVPLIIFFCVVTVAHCAFKLRSNMGQTLTAGSATAPYGATVVAQTGEPVVSVPIYERLAGGYGIALAPKRKKRTPSSASPSWLWPK
mmetsp:Transcript_92220/g.177812  ORF Transcript_92220/g.177812 Transcript_92220/m.177812 type:complete len:463 (-) Transcript_92220:49-1437(-)